ncbi:MAG: biotin--[acetyl-CoA-carboxylase] ligase [Gemmatimonadota bacterium]|nr:biotin--[acetyl-CoA-carboxylase] ligase [Gemmatimonadota bacterium]
MSRRQAKTWAGEGVEALRERWGRESVYVFGKVDSTNAAARELADEGAPSGTIVLAREQTAGRGRGEREWISPRDGGLYLSMLFRPGGPPVTALAAIVAGMDVARELARPGEDFRPRVKWPNDLMARDRKLGGILAEAGRDEEGGARLVVGVGINVVADRLPADLEGAIALDECLEDPALPEVADAAVRGLERRLTDPPAALDEDALDELDRMDWLRNRRVRHELPDREPLEGVATGIAPDGALLLRPDRGALRRVVAGTVRVIGDDGP